MASTSDSVQPGEKQNDDVPKHGVKSEPITRFKLDCIYSGQINDGSHLAGGTIRTRSADRATGGSSSSASYQPPHNVSHFTVTTSRGKLEVPGEGRSNERHARGNDANEKRDASEKPFVRGSGRRSLTVPGRVEFQRLPAEQVAWRTELMARDSPGVTPPRPSLLKEVCPKKRFQNVGQLWEMNAKLSKQIADLQIELQRIVKNAAPGSLTGESGTPMDRKLVALQEQLEKFQQMQGSLERDNSASSDQHAKSDTPPDTPSSADWKSDRVLHVPTPFRNRQARRSFNDTFGFYDGGGPTNNLDSSWNPEAPGRVENTLLVRRKLLWAERFAAAEGAFLVYGRKPNSPTRFRGCLPDFTVQFLGHIRKGYELLLTPKEAKSRDADTKDSVPGSVHLLLPTKDSAEKWFRVLWWGSRLPPPDNMPLTHDLSAISIL